MELSSHVECLAKKLYIHKLGDWYSISKPLVKWAGYRGLLNRYSTIENLVRTAYPTHPWDHREFKQGQVTQMSPQKFLLRIIKTLFPEPTLVQLNARNMAHGLRSTTGRFLEIDVFLPELKLGFEYQDEMHYFQNQPNLCSTLTEYQERDKLKSELALEKGITIFFIPFWWDWNVDSLITTIKLKRKDLLLHIESTAAPISCFPPPHILTKYDRDIPGFGMPMFAMYAPQTQSFDPTNWLIFEKYDGSRTIWNCEERRFYSRWGAVFPLPNYISDTMPNNQWLDAEIWFGREKGMRYQSTKLIQAAPHLVLWSKFQLIIFDIPSPSIMQQPYTKRHQFLLSIMCNKSHPFIHIAPYTTCTSKSHVESAFFNIRTQGGEGIILRDPFAPYVHGYSRFLYKHKGFKDAEALVVSQKSPYLFLCKVSRHYEIGAYSNASTGPLYYFVEMGVDTTTLEASEKITPGQFVSFRYITNNSGGPPLDPKIYTIRHDVHSLEPQHLISSKQPVVNPPQQHQLIWKPRTQTSWKNVESHKAYFDEFAKKKNFNPLIADNWYKVSESELAGEANFLQTYYSHSVKTALMSIYPDIGLNPRKFSVIPKHHWKSMENKRLFFEECAKSMNFNPLIPDNWYNIKSDSFFKCFPKVWALAKPFGGSVAKTLMHVFPYIGLQEHKFKALPNDHYTHKENRKRVFDNFAAEHGFDPLLHSNWVFITPSMFRNVKGGRAVMRYYTSVLMAASDFYPLQHG
eukprot:Phypoly_transcript_02505.p1 GENE.Phypoly_transcript_02505~~Phypoly_transcript_02505.p1  ORF type:complete len:743 (+),score=67.33 Phypoly_transcript_02505:95-2323(+)